MWIFVITAVVAILGYFSDLRPAFANTKGVVKPIGMTETIQIFMLLAELLL